MSSTTPSSIARRIASEQWPDVQQSYKIAPGVFNYSCAGHGGIVAIIGVADLPEPAVEAARRSGLVESFIIYRKSARRTGIITVNSFAADSYRERVEEWAKANAWAVIAQGEAWIGEEDCGWATIVSSSESIRAGWVKATASRCPNPEQWAEDYSNYAEDSVSRWWPKFVERREELTAAAQ